MGHGSGFRLWLEGPSCKPDNGKVVEGEDAILLLVPTLLYFYNPHNPLELLASRTLSLPINRLS